MSGSLPKASSGVKLPIASDSMQVYSVIQSVTDIGRDMDDSLHGECWRDTAETPKSEGGSHLSTDFE